MPTNKPTEVFTVREGEWNIIVDGILVPATFNSKGAAAAGIPVELMRRARRTGTVVPEPKLIVLCLNDYPIGVYTTSALADEAAVADWKKREPHWKEHHLTALGTAFQYGLGVYMRHYYHQHEFEVDAAARL